MLISNSLATNKHSSRVDSTMRVLRLKVINSFDGKQRTQFTTGLSKKEHTNGQVSPMIGQLIRGFCMINVFVNVCLFYATSLTLILFYSAHFIEGEFLE
jgi:hypothetical protein